MHKLHLQESSIDNYQTLQLHQLVIKSNQIKSNQIKSNQQNLFTGLQTKNETSETGVRKV